MQDHILIRYGELALKKTNRNQFISRISQNLRRALIDFPNLKYKSCGLRYYIELNGEDALKVSNVLKKIPGIYSFSIVNKCESNLDDIKILAKELLELELAKGKKTFKVETNRGDKNFPLNSIEISKEVSRYLFKNIPDLTCDVHNPDITINIDLRIEGTFIYSEVIQGLKGLPAGCLGKGLLMVSGGIDSVVAGYEAIKRGISIEAIHFASPPYTSDLAVQKVIDLLEVLTAYTDYQDINLYIVPFTEIQKQIYEHVREDYGITIMRRMMYRIATKIAEENNLLTIINGENVGQVASQTLESMNAIGSVTNMNILRPLVTFDKEEIIKISKQIETFDISIKPYEDCCTVFVPKHPQIKPQIKNCLIEEHKFDYEPLINDAVNNIQKITLKKGKHYSIVGNTENIF